MTTDLLDERGAARFLSLKNAKTLAAWRLRRTGPAYIKVGANVRYARADLEKFIASHRVEPAMSP